MSILINKDTKIITQGITGKTGQFHTEKCIEYANGKNCFVAGVNPKKAGERIFDVPIYASVKDAKAATGATVSVIYVPPAGAADAIWEACEADLDLAICITEGIPVRDMLVVRNKMKQKVAKGGKETLLLGPNCPGLITPDEVKIGIMPGHIHRKGRIGVVSRSGTLTYEAVAQLRRTIDLDPDYEYVAIGEPKRNYFWILSRKPTMNDSTYQNILRRAEAMGFNPARVEKTPQSVDVLKGSVVVKR